MRLKFIKARPTSYHRKLMKTRDTDFFLEKRTVFIFFTFRYDLLDSDHLKLIKYVGVLILNMRVRAVC